jgi:hypothetical protein
LVGRAAQAATELCAACDRGVQDKKTGDALASTVGHCASSECPRSGSPQATNRDFGFFVRRAIGAAAPIAAGKMTVKSGRCEDAFFNQS